MMDMVATGVLQGTRGGLFADANPKYVIFMLPFLIENWDQAIRLANSGFTAEINHGAREHGFHVPATGEVIAIVRWLALMCINLVLFVYSIVWIRQTGDFLMPAMGLPQWVAQISVPIGCGLSFGYCASGCLKAIAIFRNGEDREC